MWKIVFAAALPMLPLAVAHGAATGGAAAAAGSEVRCEILTVPTPHGLRLQGTLIADAPFTGTYSFEVRKSGRAGSSNSVQAGEFSAFPGDTPLGEVVVGLERGAKYEARLTVEWRGGQTSCTALGPDRT